MSLSPNDLFERAKSALMAGDTARAAEQARRVLQAAPGAWPAHYLLAVAERRNGRLQIAREAFEAALAGAPDNADIHNNYADLLSESGEAEAALAHYRRAVSLRPGHVDAWLNLSLAEQAAGAPGRAREAVEAAVRAGPDEARAWTMLGWSRQADGDGEAADEALRRAVALAPNSGRVVRALAELEVDRGGDALALFDRAASLDPQDAETALARAVAAHAAGDPAALTAIETLASATPGWIVPHQALAKLAIAGGRPDEAGDSFERALAARPRDGALWGAYLQTLSKLGDHAAVLATVERARRQIGWQASLDLAAAIAFDESGEHERAGAILERLDKDGEDQSVGEAVVRWLLRTGRIEAAERRAALGVAQPAGRGLWAYLATAWRILGDPRSTWLEAPSFVQALDLDEGADLAAEAAPVLRRLHTDSAAPLGQTLRGGSQTEGRLFLRREPPIQRLVGALKRAVEAYVADLPPLDEGHPLLSGPRAPLRFSGSWSVRLAGGGLHVNHVHPDGWLSSAFYLALPPSPPEGSTEGWLTLGEPPVELGLALEPFALIEPRPGRLALFPSYTWHGTRRFPAGERLTVAFDIIAG